MDLLDCWDCKRECVMKNKYKDRQPCLLCKHGTMPEISKQCKLCIEGACRFEEMVKDG